MKKLATLLAGAALILAAGSAWAIPTLRLTDGFVTIDIADGSALDANTNAGAVTYIGAVGQNWTLNVATGITMPFQGTALVPYMDLNSVNSSSGAGSLEILFSETGFISNPLVNGFLTDVGGTTQGTFELRSFYDVNNALFGTTGALADLGPYSAGSFSGSETNIADTGNDGDLYSLTLDAIITHTGRGTTSFDAQLTPVPEPGTMVLLGAGLLGLAIFGKRRMNKEA